MFELGPDYTEIIMNGGRDPAVLGYFSAFVGRPVPVHSFELVTKRLLHYNPEGDVIEDNDEVETVVTGLALDFTFDEAAALLNEIAAREKSLKYKIAAKEFGAFVLGVKWGRGTRGGVNGGALSANLRRLTIMADQGVAWTQLPEDYYSRTQVPAEGQL